MKRSSSSIKFIILLLVIITMFSTTCFAAWWGTPGYEWALKQKMISVKTQNQLNEYVSTEDVYDIILKYLKLKDVEKQDKTITRIKEDTNLNPVMSGIYKLIEEYLVKEELTPAEYREVDKLITHASTMINEQTKYLTRQNLKDIDLYLSLARYKAAQMINHYEYRASVMSSIKIPKYADIVSYGVVPYSGDMTRREFLIMMYKLLVNTATTNYEKDGIINPSRTYESGTFSTNDVNADASRIIEEYAIEGVLLGYNNDLMLDKRITYAEILTFLHRFETVEFNPILVEEEPEAKT